MGPMALAAEDPRLVSGEHLLSIGFRERMQITSCPAVWPRCKASVTVTYWSAGPHVKILVCVLKKGKGRENSGNGVAC